MSGGQSDSTAMMVVSIECLKSTSKPEEWAVGMLQTGDIVERIAIGGSTLKSPFQKGVVGLQKFLREKFKQNETAIDVRVRRGSSESVDIQSYSIVPSNRQYILRAANDVKFVERTESECLRLQDSRASGIVDAAKNNPVQDGYQPYPWNEKIQSTSGVFSILFLPNSLDIGGSRSMDIEDTLARAETWLTAAQATGVPISFSHIQTESLLIKISGESNTSIINLASLSELPNVANTTLYGFEDFHGIDMGMARAVRLWFSPIEELQIAIQIKDTDSILGFSMGRTSEGFIYISSVVEDNNGDIPSARSGIDYLYKQAKRDSKILVVSRISNQKVLPWIVYTTGAIRCFDTISIRQKLTLHRLAKVPIVMHLFVSDRSSMEDVESIGQWDHQDDCDDPSDIIVENSGDRFSFRSEDSSFPKGRK